MELKLSKTEIVTQRKEMVQLNIRDRNTAQESQNATSYVSEHSTKIDEKAL